MPATDRPNQPPPSTRGSGRRSGRGRAAAKRLGLVLLGCLLAVLVLELVLGALSTFYGHRSGLLPPGSGAVVLTVGDSHTFGVFYPPEESYPGRLQSLLDARSPGAYRVVNLGLPGMNSSEVVTRLPDWADRYHPRFVVFCAGANNRWNLTDSDVDQRRPTWTRWVLGSRTARLLRLIAFAQAEPAELPSDTGRPRIERVLIDGGRQGVEHRDADTGELLVRHQGHVGHRARDVDTATALLADDLATLQRLARERDFEPILLTYAARSKVPGDHLESLERMSDTMVDFGAEQGLRLVDPRPRFNELLAGSDDRTPYFHTQRDGHPNAAGYDEVARLVAKAIAGDG